MKWISQIIRNCSRPMKNTLGLNTNTQETSILYQSWPMTRGKSSRVKTSLSLVGTMGLLLACWKDWKLTSNFSALFKILIILSLKSRSKWQTAVNLLLTTSSALSHLVYFKQDQSNFTLLCLKKSLMPWKIWRWDCWTSSTLNFPLCFGIKKLK